MPAVKRPGVAESSPGAETQRRKTCGTLHPAHVTSGKPWRSAPMVDGGRPEEWPHLSLGHPPTAGEWCIPAPQVEAGHCGSPASSPEPQGAVGSERRLHRPDRVCGPCRERGSPPEQCADEPAIHGLRRSRRRQSTRSRGKPGTGERTPGEETCAGSRSGQCAAEGRRDNDREGDATPVSHGRGGTPLPGEPGALNGARRVRRRA
jgi:hypothetical protein